MESIVTKAVAICFCVFILSLSGCEVAQQYTRNSAVRDMVKAGADPLDAACSVGYSERTICAIRAAKK